MLARNTDQSSKNRKFSTISLFSGAGGIDYGLEAAGFETSVCVEMDKYCCETLRKNRTWPVIEKRIEDVSSQVLLETANLKVKEPALLIGGPPCQPFSKSGYWKNGDSLRLEDPRANTLEEYMRVLEDTLPFVFVIENVYGLAYKGKDEGLEFLREKIGKINRKKKTKYSFKWHVINAAKYGVPQIRERVFIIGCRDGSEFKFPEHFVKSEISEDNEKLNLEPYFRNAWDAIGDLDDAKTPSYPSKVGGKWGALLPSIPEGKNYLWHTERGGGKELFGWRTRYWSFLLKLSKTMPSWTIQAQPGTAIGPFHWKNRRLTMREMARLQTFPDNVMISGGMSQIQKQIGNAVPSLITEILGKEILDQFFGVKNDRCFKLLAPKRTQVPVAETIHPVPKDYRGIEKERAKLKKS